MLRDGNAHGHPDEGEELAKGILTRLKAPKKISQRVCWLVKNHMYDFDCKTGENKLRRFFVANYDMLDDLLLIKQADFSACTDDTSTAPTCVKWQGLLAKMQAEKVPFSLKALAVNGNDLLAEGLLAKNLAFILNALLMHTAVTPSDNVKARLIRLAHGFNKSIT
jgi:hypothetical protein